MNLKDQEFDTVVLGFDEKSKETVEALQEQGKRVLYVPIDPQTMITMMAQKQVHSMETDETITHLQIQHHQMHTAFQDTTTYLLQPVVQVNKPDQQQQKREETVEDLVELDLHAPPSEDRENKEVLVEEEAVNAAASETEEDYAENHDDLEETQPIETSSDDIEEDVEIEEIEILEEDIKTAEREKEFIFPMITPLTKESSLIDNRMLGIRGSNYLGLHKNNKKNLSMLPSYHLFNPIQIEGEEDQEIFHGTAETEPNESGSTIEEPSVYAIGREDEPKLHTVQSSNVTDDNNPMFHSPSLKSNEIPVEQSTNDLEGEYHSLTLHMNSNNTVNQQNDLDGVNYSAKKLPSMDEFILQSQPEKTTSKKDDSMDEKENHEEAPTEEQKNTEPLNEIENSTDEQAKTDSHTLVLDRDIRLRKKFSFHQLHQESKAVPILESSKNEKTVVPKQEEEETAKKSDVFPLEPFSTRRRNKKNRLFSSLEAAIPNPIVQPNTAIKPEKSISNMIHNSVVKQDPEQEAKTPPPKPLENVVQEEQQSRVDTNSDQLKIDNIEFEEPYGYNSFEDIFPSFSNGNDRKRQEMDKIEKRKIALRGLHNLINNLG